MGAPWYVGVICILAIIFSLWLFYEILKELAIYESYKHK